MVKTQCFDKKKCLFSNLKNSSWKKILFGWITIEIFAFIGKISYFGQINQQSCHTSFEYKLSHSQMSEYRNCVWTNSEINLFFTIG